MGLQEYLDANGLSYEQFAAQVGVHATTIYRLLKGSTIPKRENLKRILAATHGAVDVADLMQPVVAPQETTKEAEPT